MNKMLEKLDNVVFSNYIDLDIITYFIDVIYLININLDDDSFDEDDLANIVLIRPDVIDLNNVKYVKKKDRQRTNTYSMVSNKSVGLVHDKRWKVMEW